jgi:glutathionylspermidine synthase
MTAVDSLMMDAKQAIMDEHHRRFQTLYQEGRWEEALQQIHVTLSCATDLLNESLRVLNEAFDGTTTTPQTIPLPLPQSHNE